MAAKPATSRNCNPFDAAGRQHVNFAVTCPLRPPHDAERREELPATTAAHFFRPRAAAEAGEETLPSGSWQAFASQYYVIAAGGDIDVSLLSNQVVDGRR